MIASGCSAAIPRATDNVPSPVSPATAIRRVGPSTCSITAATTANSQYNPATMPLVKLYLRRGKSPEYRKMAADAVHEALVAQGNVPADDRFQIIHELDEG